MPTISDLELFKAAYKTVKEIIRVKEGEVVHPDLVELAKACGH
jgi:hypothetical protein